MLFNKLCIVYLKRVYGEPLIKEPTYFQNMKFNDFDDGAMRWLSDLLCILYIYISDYVIDFELMVILCSTTGSYGRFVIEVAYGETLFHSTKAVWR